MRVVSNAQNVIAGSVVYCNESVLFLSLLLVGNAHARLYVTYVGRKYRKGRRKTGAKGLVAGKLRKACMACNLRWKLYIRRERACGKCNVRQ